MTHFNWILFMEVSSSSSSLVSKHGSNPHKRTCVRPCDPCSGHAASSNMCETYVQSTHSQSSNLSKSIHRLSDYPSLHLSASAPIPPSHAPRHPSSPRSSAGRPAPPTHHSAPPGPGHRGAAAAAAAPRNGKLHPKTPTPRVKARCFFGFCGAFTCIYSVEMRSLLFFWLPLAFNQCC